MEQTQTEYGVKLLRLTRRCRGMDKQASAGVGLSVDEMHCLGVLFSDRPSSVKMLSGLINVTQTRASKILRDLEHRGFVSRALDLADHRREHVKLTENGTQVVEKLLSLYNEIGGKFMGSLPGEPNLEFSQLLQTDSHSG